jgi:hypothetical protein
LRGLRHLKMHQASQPPMTGIGAGR